MIDFPNLFFNSLWILACALALAALSITSWDASQARRPWRSVLSGPGPQAAFNVAGLLFCAGLAGTSTVLWERLLWAALGLAFLLQLTLPWLLRLMRKPKSGG